VKELSPLSGLPLTKLWCSRTPVSDLSPLKALPLLELFCDSTKVTDLTPLEGMRLQALVFSPKDCAKGIEVIRQMKSIEKIAATSDQHGAPWMPAAEFWKKYDAGEFNK
jgi:hypothetical protein